MDDEIRMLELELALLNKKREMAEQANTAASSNAPTKPRISQGSADGNRGSNGGGSASGRHTPDGATAIAVATEPLGVGGVGGISVRSTPDVAANVNAAEGQPLGCGGIGGIYGRYTPDVAASVTVAEGQPGCNKDPLSLAEFAKHNINTHIQPVQDVSAATCKLAKRA